MWLKTLVAVTCFAVLAAIGYYFWQDQQDRRMAAEAEDRRAEASMVAFCRQMLVDLKSRRSDDYKVYHLTSCLDGRITEDDVRTAGLAHILDQLPTQ